MQDVKRKTSQSPVAPRAVVILCTYNERENIEQIVQQLHEHLAEADILVVDDSSPDGTGAWVEAHSSDDSHLRLLSRPEKSGLGAALRAGLRWSLERDYEYVINLDADLSHNPAMAPQLLRACQSAEAPCDVAIASRYIPGGGFSGLPWHRRILSRALNGYATRILRLPIHDCSGSFRCYRASELRQLDLESLTCSGYGFLEELLVALHRRGVRFCEFPIVFTARTKGRSKLGVPDALGAIRVIHRLALRR